MKKARATCRNFNASAMPSYAPSTDMRRLTIKTVRDGEVVDEDAMTNTIEKESQQEFNTKLDENGEIVYAEDRVASGRAC